ncbi:MAG TPA: hypothetical protein VF144_11880 [Chitinophagaceae bacterium]
MTRRLVWEVIEGSYPTDKIIIEVPPDDEILPERDFYDQLESKTGKETVEFAKQIIKDCETLDLYLFWNDASFTIRLPDPQGSDVKIPIFRVEKNGHVNLSFSGGAFKKVELSMDMAISSAADTAKLFKGIKPRPNRPWVWDKDSTLSELRKVYPQFMDRVKKYIDDITKEGEKSSR